MATSGKQLSSLPSATSISSSNEILTWEGTSLAQKATRDDFIGSLPMFRQPITAYAVGDYAFSLDLPAGWYLYCTVNGTTSNNPISLPSALVENATITDGTVTWKVRKISSADGVPIATILPYASNGNIPSGYLLCDGAAVSRTMFPDLFACIGTTYGAGDGSTTFNLPDYNDAQRFVQGSTTAGTVKSAGLPDIIGYIGAIDAVGAGTRVSGTSGACEAINTINNTSNGLTGGISATLVSGEHGVRFQASKYNSIYGNSTTVQPPSLTARYIIKAFDGQTSDSALINLTQYAADLANKADRSLSNLTEAGKSFSFPSDTYISVPITNSTSMQYTAPADGWVMARMNGAYTGNAYIIVTVDKIESCAYSATGGLGFATTIPVKKGQVVAIVANLTTISEIYFTYAAGEVPA